MRLPAALLLLAACGDSVDTIAYTIDTLPSGTVRVVNQAPSSWTDSSGLALVLEHTIAPADGSPGELAYPREIGTLADGRVVVNDGGGAGILLFDADGNFARVIGRHGEGPGEYGQIFSMATAGTTVYVQECNKGRLTRFHVDADSTSQWQSDDCMAGEGVVIDGEGGIWLDGRLREPTRSVLFRWEAPGERRDTFALPEPQEPALWMAGNAAVPIPFSPHSLTAGTPPVIWSGHGGSLTFHRINAQGDTLRSVSVAGDAAVITDSVRQQTIDRFANSPRFASVVRVEDVPTTQPLFTRLDIDGQQRLWVHRPGPDGNPAHFEVIDTSGTWLGTVAAPPGAGWGMHWANGRMYRVAEGADGAPIIEIYRVERRNP